MWGQTYITEWTATLPPGSEKRLEYVFCPITTWYM
jgi:hypothetical protein